MSQCREQYETGPSSWARCLMKIGHDGPHKGLTEGGYPATWPDGAAEARRSIEAEIVDWAVSWTEFERSAGLDGETYGALKVLASLRRRYLWKVERNAVPEVVKTVQRSEVPLHACAQCGKRLRLSLRPVGLKLWCSTSCRHLWFVCRARSAWSYSHISATGCEVCGQETDLRFRAAPVCDVCQSRHKMDTWQEIG